VFFGTAYLCGIDPPVLKLHKDERGRSEYVSVVRSAPPFPAERRSASSRSGSPTGSASGTASASDPYESLSDEHDESAGAALGAAPSPPSALAVPPAAAAPLPSQSNSLPADAEIRKLLHRKEELEKRKQRQDKQRQRVQVSLSQIKYKRLDGFLYVIGDRNL